MSSRLVPAAAASSARNARHTPGRDATSRTAAVRRSRSVKRPSARMSTSWLRSDVPAPMPPAPTPWRAVSRMWPRPDSSCVTGASAIVESPWKRKLAARRGPADPSSGAPSACSGITPSGPPNLSTPTWPTSRRDMDVVSIASASSATPAHPFSAMERESSTASSTW
eukprot:351780-Chlamydomonas_euryale.AAC.3